MKHPSAKNFVFVNMKVEEFATNWVSLIYTSEITFNIILSLTHKSSKLSHHPWIYSVWPYPGKLLTFVLGHKPSCSFYFRSSAYTSDATDSVQKAIPCSYIERDRCCFAGKTRTIESGKVEYRNMTLMGGIAQESVACLYKTSQRLPDDRDGVSPRNVVLFKSSDATGSPRRLYQNSQWLFIAL